MNKKGFVSVHAGMFFMVGLVIGLVVMWYAMTQGWIPFGSASSWQSWNNVKFRNNKSTRLPVHYYRSGNYWIDIWLIQQLTFWL